MTKPTEQALRAAREIHKFNSAGTPESTIASVIDAETCLPALLEALRPFAEAAEELHKIGSISRRDQWLWKPSSNSRETKGINAQHLLNAAALLASKKEAK